MSVLPDRIYRFNMLPIKNTLASSFVDTRFSSFYGQAGDPGMQLDTEGESHVQRLSPPDIPTHSGTIAESLTRAVALLMTSSPPTDPTSSQIRARISTYEFGGHTNTQTTVQGIRCSYLPSMQSGLKQGSEGRDYRRPQESGTDL